MNFKSLNIQRKLILISAAAGIISVFLPWFSAGAFGFSVHVNGFHGWGILAFFCFAAAIAISLSGKHTDALDKNFWFAAIVSGGLALLSIVITIFSSRTGSFGLVSAGMSTGIWLSLAASAGIIAFAWKLKKPGQDLKTGFENFKHTIAASASTKTSSNVFAEGNRIAELERLSKLKENGSLTEEEFQQLKSKLL